MAPEKKCISQGKQIYMQTDLYKLIIQWLYLLNHFLKYFNNFNKTKINCERFFSYFQVLWEVLRPFSKILCDIWSKRLCFPFSNLLNPAGINGTLSKCILNTRIKIELFTLIFICPAKEINVLILHHRGCWELWVPNWFSSASTLWHHSPLVYWIHL